MPAAVAGRGKETRDPFKKMPTNLFLNLISWGRHL